MRGCVLKGKKARLSAPLETYESYYAKPGAALGIAGSELAHAALADPWQHEFMEIAKRAWRRAGQDAGLFIKIDDMLQRIRP